MKRFIITMLTSTLLVSCGANKILVEKLEKINVNYNTNQAYYFGDTIEMKFEAVKKTGEKINISNRNQLKVDVQNATYFERDEILVITNRPTNFNIESIAIKAIFEDENGKTKSVNEEIPLSFNHPIHINFNGENGESSRDRANRLIGRGVVKEGRPGRDGENGDNGKDAEPIIAHVWKQDGYNMIKVSPVGTNDEYVFKTKQADITISASGGNGGNGGDGGDGGRGRRGSSSEDRLPGDGGNGGNGGDGADGGNGAMINVYIHPNAADLRETITLINQHGLAGKGGQAGSPGEGGRGASGQKNGNPGIKGSSGSDGSPGKPGPKPAVEIKEFKF